MSTLFNKSSKLLEPYEGKLSRTVLRGESPRKGADLLDSTFEGTFTARLDCRAWPQKCSKTPILMCCFTLEDGRKIKLGAIRRGKNTSYTAKQSDICAVQDMDDGTLWRVTIKKTRNGHFGWEDAEPLEG